nr:hypothetical protein [Kofleriaceae bacterium]
MAFADGDPAAGGDASGGAPATPAAPAATTTAAPAAGGDWMQLDQRPLLIPTGKLAIDAIVPFFAVHTIEIDPTTGQESDSTDLSIGASVAVNYGVNDKLEVGGGYAFNLKDFDATGTLYGHGAYLVSHTDKMDIGVAAALSFDLHSSGDVDLAAGAWIRYRLAPKLTLFTGQPAMIPDLPVGGFGGFIGPTGYQFTANLNNGNAVELGIPVGVGYQATPNVWVYGQTLLANLVLNGGGDNAFIFSDFIPITLGAWYSMDKLDVGASFGDDLKNAGDFYAITLNARYWVK